MIKTHEKNVKPNLAFIIKVFKPEKLTEIYNKKGKFNIGI